LKKSKGARKSSAWFQRHANDPHVKRAQREGKRSRAAFKLSEILERYELLNGRDTVVVDLGCAPGSWCQELTCYCGDGGMVIGVDLLEMRPLPGVRFLQMDFSDMAAHGALEEVLEGRRVDMVVSDMAPELSGNKVVDQARIINLNEMTLGFAVNHLREGGHLLLKTFMGEGFDTFRKELMGWFSSVKTVKPAASRKSSSEIYLLGQAFRRM